MYDNVHAARDGSKFQTSVEETDKNIINAIDMYIAPVTNIPAVAVIIGYLQTFKINSCVPIEIFSQDSKRGVIYRHIFYIEKNKHTLRVVFFEKLKKLRQ